MHVNKSSLYLIFSKQSQKSIWDAIYYQFPIIWYHKNDFEISQYLTRVFNSQNVKSIFISQNSYVHVMQ